MMQPVTESAPKSAVPDTSINISQSEPTPVPAATKAATPPTATRPSPKTKGKGKNKKPAQGKAQAEGAAARPPPPQRPAVDPEKLKQLKEKLGDVASRTGGKGSVRRKFKGQRKVRPCHRTALVCVTLILTFDRRYLLWVITSKSKLLFKRLVWKKLGKCYV